MDANLGGDSSRTEPPRSGDSVKREPVSPALRALGRRLLQARKARGLSQLDIGEHAQVTRAAVSQWERGLVEPTEDNLRAAAERLQVAYDWLRSGSGLKPDLRRQPTGRRAVRYIGMPVLAASVSADQPPFPGGVAEMEGGVGAADPYQPRARVRDWWRLPDRVVRGFYQTQPERLRVFRVRSDTMEPAIRLHSYVLVDLAQRRPVDGAVFAIDNGLSAVLKRVYVLPGQHLKLVSDNEDARTARTFAPNDISVIGRVIAQFCTV